jgi:hypothetical protein
MKIPFFEIPDGFELTLSHFLSERGYALVADGKEKVNEECTEQYWSVVYENAEVFQFSLARFAISGKLVLIFGAHYTKTDLATWNLLLEEIPKLGGKQLKELPL